jgi:hypothetical protein
MAFSAKRQTIINPKIVTNGLIFYIDPNSLYTRTVPGFIYKDLTNYYSTFTSICAGNLLSNFNTLTTVGDNYFINLNNTNLSVSGNIGPISGLSSYTIQFWFKNNKNDSTFRKFFTSPVNDQNTGGFCLSGLSNNITFKPNNLPPYQVDASLFSTNSGTWNCITLAQNNNVIYLYKNNNRTIRVNDSSNTLNLSSILINDDITLGQVFIYNRFLPLEEVKTNYDSFKSRYRVDDAFNLQEFYALEAMV